MAPGKLPDRIVLPPTADMHVHLREDTLMELCTPHIRPGGADTVYVMPNLIQPLTTVSRALSYKSQLQSIEPRVTYLMTLYLHPSLTPESIAAASAAGISGVKAYPAGVTTGSAAGVVNWKSFYPIFAAMAAHDLVLNLHGEVPTPPASQLPDSVPAINVLTAEELFLPTLKQIHTAFPTLRIVLEHCTTSAALDAVASCGPTVAASITAHHLWLTLDDVVSDVDNFCKPVAKSEHDRRALLRAAMGMYDQRLQGRIFFGSDSAPHAETKKHVGVGEKSAAGCFTQPYVTPLVIGAVEKGIEDGVLEREMEDSEWVDRLKAFLSENGRRFYGAEALDARDRIVLERGGEETRIIQSVRKDGGKEVVNCFRGGQQTWRLSWIQEQKSAAV